MSVRAGRTERARRRALVLVEHAGTDLRAARELSGLSLRQVREATGVSESALRRLELGRLQDITVARLAVAADAVGLNLALKLYPGSDPLRDAPHNALLERLHLRIHPSLGWQREVPLPADRDLRSWDVVIAHPPEWRPVEAETRLGDFQALDRRINLKMRDGGAEHVILLVADTRTNRAALGAAPEAWTAAFPTRTRAALAALGVGKLPEGSALIVL